MPSDRDSYNTSDSHASAAGNWPQPAADSAEKSRTGGPKLASILLIVLFVFSGMFAAFAGGMVFERAVASPDTEPVAQQQPVDEEPTETFARAWQVVTDHYVDTSAINEEQMLSAAIQGMLDTLGDEGHTRFLTAEETQLDRESSQGTYVGIGVLVETTDDEQYRVVTPFEGSPAFEAGVSPGDIIVAVDGQEVDEQTLQEVIAQIRGEEGTSVDVTFMRDGERITHTLVRSRITISSVSWTMLEDDIALLRLSQFTNGAGDDLARALEEAKAEGAEGVILDLRNNPGGYIREAMQVASMFVPDNSVVYISETRDGGRVEHRSDRGDTHIGDTPFVVLINEGSASSSEIVSGAIKSADVATVIGEVTVGTGTVLNQFELGDGSTIWLGVELWLTPDGEMIREHGIRPDVVVGLGEDQFPFSVHPHQDSEAPPEELNDNQLEYAIRVLQSGEAGAKNPIVGGPNSRMQ